MDNKLEFGYITKSNFQKIISKISFSNNVISNVKLDEEISIFLDNNELEEWSKLYFFREFLTDVTMDRLKNLAHDLTRNGRCLFPDKMPRFHSNSFCKGLNSDYENYLIPEDIPNLLIENYRQWCYDNFYNAEFDRLHFERWGCEIGRKVFFQNSGVGNLDVIVSEIDKVYSRVISKCDHDYKFKIVFQLFCKNSAFWEDEFLCSTLYSARSEIRKNGFGNVLSHYDQLLLIDLDYVEFRNYLSFISETKEDILNLYSMKFVSEGGTKIQISHLCNMGFVMCSRCFQ